MQATETLASAMPAAFESLSELRREHLRLLRAVHGDSKATGVAVEIQSFLERAEATGRYIDGHSDREAVQGVLDYWSAALFKIAGPGMVSVEMRLLQPFDPELTPDLNGVATPFRGLSSFRESDAEQFFGREEEVRTLILKVAREPLVVVVGPSGSGKSSLVVAGLLPRLKNGTLPGSEAWQYLPVVVPGADPLSALLLSARAADIEPRDWVAEHRPQLMRSGGHFRKLQESGNDARPAVLIVDQLEELFTLCTEARARQQFVEAILEFMQSRSGSNRLILVIREDFFSQLLHFPPLKRLVNNPEARFSPRPLTVHELRLVIERPAETVGLKFEDGIVDDLIKEVLGDPTALPLLQLTLQKLWEYRERSRITWDTYRKVGTPREALKRSAEEVYESARFDENKKAIERIFRELVQPYVGAEFVRRRVRRETLTKLEASDRVNRMLEVLVSAGLLRLTPGIVADDDRFEVVHEALIRNWPRLLEWLHDERRHSERKLQLQNAAKLWIESGRKDGYLLSGDALAEAKSYAEESPELRDLVKESESHQWKSAWKVIAFTVLVLLLATLVVLVASRRSLAEAERAATAERIANDSLRQALISRDSAREVARVQVSEIRTNVAQALADLATDSVGKAREDPQTVSAVIQRVITETTTGRRNFWPDSSTLRIRFLDGTPELQAQVAGYAQEWTKYANLTFDFNPDSSVYGDIRITFAGSAAWSFIGRQARNAAPSSPTMSLGGLDGRTQADVRRIVLFQFGHALGLAHELQNPIADIPWDTAAVLSYFKRYYNYSEAAVRRDVLSRYGESVGYVRPFDPRSIMHAFRIPPELTQGRYDIRRNFDLSESDKRLISRIYPGRQWDPE